MNKLLFLCFQTLFMILLRTLRYSNRAYLPEQAGANPTTGSILFTCERRCEVVIWASALNRH